MMEQRKVNVWAYRKQTVKGVKRGTLEVAANYFTMEFMEEEMVRREMDSGEGGYVCKCFGGEEGVRQIIVY